MGELPSNDHEKSPTVELYFLRGANCPFFSFALYLIGVQNSKFSPHTPVGRLEQKIA